MGLAQSLFEACSEGDVLRVRKLLVEQGANVNVQDESEWTPLHTACSNGHVLVVLELLQKGANPQAVAGGCQEFNPLHCAAWQGYTDVARVLMEWHHQKSCSNKSDDGTTKASRNIGIDATSKNGFTALHLACAYGHFKTVQLLLKQGADMNARTNRKGNTCLHLACRNGCLAVVKVLLQHLVHQQKSNKTTTVSNSSIMNQGNALGNTPLHLAVAHHGPSSEITKILLRHEEKSATNSSRFQRNNYGETPFTQKQQRLDSNNNSGTLLFGDRENSRQGHRPHDMRPLLLSNMDNDDTTDEDHCDDDSNNDILLGILSSSKTMMGGERSGHASNVGAAALLAK